MTEPRKRRANLRECLIGAALRVMKWLPAALDRVHLEWALREIDPMHPDVHYIVHRLRELERT